MNTMTTSPGPARRALACDVTPLDYANEMREAFETLSWIDRLQAHRVRGGGDTTPRDCSLATSRLLASQYHAAMNVGDAVSADYLRAALDAHAGVVEAARFLRGDA